MQAILERYHEEQVWSDKVGSGSGFGTACRLMKLVLADSFTFDLRISCYHVAECVSLHHHDITGGALEAETAR